MNDIKSYYFSEKIAKDVGVEEAIMLNNIYFWVNHNQKNEDNYHFHDGKYWMFNAIRDFTEQYSFWTQASIRRILNKLKKKEYIETGVFNKFGYDKTKWYTITQKTSDILGTTKEIVENGDWNSFE